MPKGTTLGMDMKKYYALIIAALLAGCTDGGYAKLQALGGSGHVKCFSGDMLIYEGDSTGVISNSENSDGYYFVDASDNKLKEVSGNCVVTYTKY